MKARFLWATVIALILLSLPALVQAQPPIVPSIESSGDGVEVGPLGSPDALWNQPSDGTGAVASQYFPSYCGCGFYSADDFSNAQPWNIESIFVEGVTPAAVGGLFNANSLNWFIYPDAAGVPAGYPDFGGELWSYSCLPTAPEVTLSGPNNEQATLDILKAQGAPLYLPPGTYWLGFYPDLNIYIYWQYFWYRAGTTNLAPAHGYDRYWIINPWFSWTPWTVSNPAIHDLAFRLEGDVLPPFDVKYLHSKGGLFNLTDPIGTQWHELYPLFCREYHLSSWEDNGDGVLSPSDQIDMYQKPDGEVRWYHVDEVTITLFVRPGRDGGGLGINGLAPPMYIELEGGYNASVLISPVCTQWHEVYPVFCKRYHLSDWIDNGSRMLDPCDDILLTNKWTEEPTWWHVEEVSVDIIVTMKPPPVGGEAYPVKKASLLAPWIAIAAILAGGAIWYVLRRRRIQS